MNKYAELFLNVGLTIVEAMYKAYKTQTKDAIVKWANKRSGIDCAPLVSAIMEVVEDWDREYHEKHDGQTT